MGSIVLFWILREKFLVLAVAFLRQILLRDKPKGRGVHAIAEPRGRGPVVKHMAQVGVGLFAAHFGAGREKASVLLFHDVFRL